jgi:hypothetical protein
MATARGRTAAKHLAASRQPRALSANPMDPQAAPGAVEKPSGELPLKISFEADELDPEILRGEHGSRVLRDPHGGQGVDEVVGVSGLLGDRSDGLFQDVALPLHQTRKTNVSIHGFQTGATSSDWQAGVASTCWPNGGRRELRWR